MADSKTQAKPAAKTAQETQEATFAAQEALPTSGSRFIAIARLRRDTMILDSGQDEQALIELAASAVREGRAAEVFILPVLAYFSESSIDFQAPERSTPSLRADQNPERVPLLNPSTGEHALDAAAADQGNAPKAPTPTQGATQGGDDNKGAGTGNETPAEKPKD